MIDFSWYYLKIRLRTHARPVRISRSRWPLRACSGAPTNTGAAVFSIIVRCVDSVYHINGVAMAGICNRNRIVQSKQQLNTISIQSHGPTSCTPRKAQCRPCQAWPRTFAGAPRKIKPIHPSSTVIVSEHAPMKAHKRCSARASWSLS